MDAVNTVDINRIEEELGKIEALVADPEGLASEEVLEGRKALADLDSAIIDLEGAVPGIKAALRQLIQDENIRTITVRPKVGDVIRLPEGARAYTLGDARGNQRDINHFYIVDESTFQHHLQQNGSHSDGAIVHPADDPSRIDAKFRVIRAEWIEPVGTCPDETCPNFHEPVYGVKAVRLDESGSPVAENIQLLPDLFGPGPLILIERPEEEDGPAPEKTS